MDHPPKHDERLLEALEACRPGSADLSDPALAHLAAEIAVDPALERLYERLQQIDARVAAAFQEVPVPAGLAERISERLAEAEHVRDSGGRRADGTAGDCPDFRAPTAYEAQRGRGGTKMGLSPSLDTEIGTAPETTAK